MADLIQNFADRGDLGDLEGDLGNCEKNSVGVFVQVPVEYLAEDLAENCVEDPAEDHAKVSAEDHAEGHAEVPFCHCFSHVNSVVLVGGVHLA